MPASLPGIQGLSPRQREVLELLTKGLTNGEIGHVLGISVTTVRTHVTAVLGALDVSNRTEAVSMFVADQARPEQLTTLLAGPAVAVLPIVAVEDDPRTRTIAAGITSDLGMLCARSCALPVIALVASSGARSLGPTSQAIGRALGARFLIDGTLRLQGASLRLTVAVADCETGVCLWTQRYDAADCELFAVQDTICESIVAAAYPVMLSRLRGGLVHAPRAHELGTWELSHEAMAVRAPRDPLSTAQARELFRLALARDPTLVHAHYGLGLCAYDEVLNQWHFGDGSAAPARHGDARDRLAGHAERCLELAPHAAEGYFLQARYFQTRGDHARATVSLDLAIGNNPSFAAAHALLAQCLHLSGRGDEAMVRMKHALRLGPRAYAAGLATLEFARGEYDAAAASAEIAVSFLPRYTYARALAAAAAWWAGDGARAAEHLGRLKNDYPAFVPSGFLRTFGPEVDSVAKLTTAWKSLGL